MTSESEALFVAAVGYITTPQILELGTSRWGAVPSHHKHWAPHGDWVLSDLRPGADVDQIADAHDLFPFSDGQFDAVMSVSLFEHLLRPWVAAEAIARVLKPGGLLYCCTHQSFPLHGYPNDYFRFSKEALSLIFEDVGLRVLSAGYVHPAKLIPPAEVTVWDPTAPVWLNVDLFGVK